MHDDADKKPIEVWAERKGMLPEKVNVPTRVGTRAATAQRQNPKFTEFRMAQAHARWPQGKEVTEAEFDAAVEESQRVGLQ